MSSNSDNSLKAEVDRLRLELQALQISTGVKGITIGKYLLTRLSQLGVRSMFGLPGDFNLGFLDVVDDFPDIDWVGNCNELNAAYAADGYARIKSSSLGVILTTFGVGELSAVNGIAGAFSEMVPVLHIVGVPSTIQQKTKPLLHHTLGDGRFDAYRQAASHFAIKNAAILDKADAAKQIDDLLTACITKARPVYLNLPTDMVNVEISSERLKIPLSHRPPSNPEQEEEFVIELIEERVKEAEGDVVVIVDACVIRHDCREEVKKFLKDTGFPVYATPMGKTAVDENYERYGGIYVGSLTAPLIKEKVESAKLIISIGSLMSDFNTGNFSYNIPKRHHIELHSDHTLVQYGRFDGIGMKNLLPKLTEKLKSFYPVSSQIKVPDYIKQLPQEETSIITHKWFWPRLGFFFKPKDVIVADTGTSNFGILEVPLPANAVMVSQILWGSIGWSVGSCLGAALAAKEVGLNRTILFVGDGSIQLTVQEISVMIRKGLKPIIFILNNKGYTIERMIHGKHRKYNDIADWNWTSLLHTLNDGNKHETASYTVHNKRELNDLLDDESFASASKIQVVEVIMDALDAPLALVRQAEMTGKGNTYGDGS
ncbi:Putative pyruvate decarboxylase C3G9.11c [Psilocybe cubensis]|uniref:Pyruvate decarboxylase C3G9.11c n=2 Tax=Psilocybe cubensis TaxID=181762 RepID=A0ACB8GY63_PSICU|nr:Putative pyruvate decarboxylase C3G9.11c [Psilocybe cubensis]KAH9480463.1 Putative pyruvate decarboxylase C3G9.11c [Psilocybe cubensis]